MLKRTILFILLSCISIVCIDAQRRWVVTDEDLTVWDSPNYLNKLGMIHRGYEITETGMDGDMIRFEYHGKTAYVAEYCCKLLKQEPAKKTEPAQREAVIEVKKSESDRASNTIQETPQQQATTANEEAVDDATDVPEMVAASKENNKSAEKVTLSSVVFSSLSSFIVPWLALCVLALILFAFFGVDVPGMFDKMADMDVADIGAKCFRPLIAATVCGITYYFTSNLDIMVGALLVYQVLLLLLRTKQLGSFRAAIVEMLYLTMIASIFVLVIIPLIFFSDRGSKKSSKRKSDDDDEISISDQYGHSVRVRKTGMNTYTGNDGHEYEESATGDFQRKMYD